MLKEKDEMKRLTAKGNRGLALLKGTSCSYSHMSYDCQDSEGIKLLEIALEKLAHYEDLEEQGFVFDVQLKRGDTVWHISKTIGGETKIVKGKVERVFVMDDDKNPERQFYFMPDGNVYEQLSGCIWLCFDEIGKTVFMSKEEAEAVVEKEKEINDEL